jgi:hypothetical protein
MSNFSAVAPASGQPPSAPGRASERHGGRWRRASSANRDLCHYEAVLHADRWPDAVLVRDFRLRMVCTPCGIIGVDARPNWREMQASGNWRSGAT